VGIRLAVESVESDTANGKLDTGNWDLVTRGAEAAISQVLVKFQTSGPPPARRYPPI